MGRLKTEKERFLKKRGFKGHVDKPGEPITNQGGRMTNYYRSFKTPFEVDSSRPKEDMQSWYCCGEYHYFPSSMPKEEARTKLLAICSVKKAPEHAIFIQNDAKEAFVVGKDEEIVLD